MDNGTLYIKVRGRLGNQLFQIMNVYSLSKKFNKSMKIIYRYDYNRFPDKQEYSILLNKLKSKFGNDVFITELPKIYTEINDPMTFEIMPDEVLSKKFIARNVIITHYLETYYYLDNKLIHDFLKIPNDVKKHISQKYGDLSSSVAISVRRGDYLKYKRKFISPTYKWYSDAYKKFFKYKDVLISSDDIKWCKDNLKFEECKSVKYVERETAESAMYALSLCQGGFIGSNSTFSWWSAWLGDNNTHSIVFPEKRWGPQYAAKQEENYIPDNWIKFRLNDDYEK